MKRIIPLVISLMIIFSGSVTEAETAIERLVKKIVTGRESNDDKVYKIERWVSKNIKYRGDKEQFNMDRLTLPMETIQRRKGDCEDGAMLIMDLAVTAGVPRERLRLYAPIVTKGGGLHASVAYQREKDHAWVWVEWTVELAYKIGKIKKRPSINRVASFIPLGDYYEVTSHNPFKIKKYFNEEVAGRAKKILEQDSQPDK
ncbi:transglutaminase-like domain-containing protein [Thermodesulfobacteriota bacterium]